MNDQQDESVDKESPLLSGGRLRPIVINTKKKKKRKYSRGLKDIQVSGSRISKISDDLARSTAKGIRAYRKASKKSAEKKRDGMLKDLGLNLGKAASKSLRSASDVPYDLAKALDSGGRRRQIRRQLRLAGRINRRLGSR